MLIHRDQNYDFNKMLAAQLPKRGLNREKSCKKKKVQVKLPVLNIFDLRVRGKEA